MHHPLEKFIFCPVCGNKSFNINDFKSKKCGTCDFTYYANPCSATAAFILNDRGELLVAKRGKEPAKGTLDLPGGFVDMVVKFTGMPVVNMDVPKFYLSLLIIYMALVPMFFPRVAFMGAAPLFLGVIEIFAHLLAAAKMNESHKFYSPGMVTSLLIMLPMTAYGFYTVISQHLVTGWNWLWAFLYLVIPLFGLQRYIIHSIGMDYRVFIGNALHALFGKGE
jgi:ribosomal protein S27AE